MLLISHFSMLKDTKNPSSFSYLFLSMQGSHTCCQKGFGCRRSLCSSTRCTERLSQLEAKAWWGWVLSEHLSCSKRDKRHPEPSSACSGQWLAVLWGVCQMRVCSTLSSCILGSRKIHPALPGSVLSLSLEQWLCWTKGLIQARIFPTGIIQVGWLECFVNLCRSKRFVSIEKGKKKATTTTTKSSRKMGKEFWKKCKCFLFWCFQSNLRWCFI